MWPKFLTLEAVIHIIAKTKEGGGKSADERIVEQVLRRAEAGEKPTRAALEETVRHIHIVGYPDPVADEKILLKPQE